MTAYLGKQRVQDEHSLKLNFRPDGSNLYFNNNGLFSENYLSHRLPEEKHDQYILEHWETEPLPEFSESYEWMLSTWAELKDVLKDLNEAQLEDKWIRPILKKLGWTYEVQDRLKKRGKTQIPDYSLFSDDKSYIKAKSAETHEAYFRHALAVADAKAMGVNLDGEGRTNSNPSYQIIRYMEDTGQTWGILTDGEYWRLYSLHSDSKFSTFYEVNLRKALANRDDSRFKYFFNFFRKEAFLAKGPSSQSFLDVVFKSGEQYAKSVETQLKDRAFRIAQAICRGFAGDAKNLSDADLNDIYQHSLYYLFRLIFLLNAEAKGIYDVNEMSDYYPSSLRALAVKIKHDHDIGRQWTSQWKSYEHISQLLNMLEAGEKSIGLASLGSEVFSSGGREFYRKRKISDHILNPAILELACAPDENEDLKFVDYKRLSADHMGSLFEGLLEFKLTVASEKLADDNGTYVPWSSLNEKKKAKLKDAVIEKSELYLENGAGERHSTGSYYTPSYIVDYLVKATLDPICKGKNTESLLGVKVCDPAMGSGHFLLGAVKYLEEIVLDSIYAREESPEINREDIRWRILHNCIHGVDINPLAVELAKFSLWMFTVRKGFELEPLSDQLKCGDSIVGEAKSSTRPFSWSDSFPEVFSNGGFHGLLGNPPYVRAEYLKLVKDHLKEKYQTFHTQADLFVYFIEKGLGLLQSGGSLGYLISNKWFKAQYGLPLRKFLGSGAVREIVDLGDSSIIDGASTYLCTMILNKASKGEASPKAFDFIKFNVSNNAEFQKAIVKPRQKISFESVSEEGWFLLGTQDAANLKAIWAKCEPLGQYIKDQSFCGIKTGLTEAFCVDQELAEAALRRDKDAKDFINPYAFGPDISAFRPATPEQFVLLIPKGWTKDNFGEKEPEAKDAKVKKKTKAELELEEQKYWSQFQKRNPVVSAHLAKYEKKARARSDMGDYWWELRACDYYDKIKDPKILYLKLQTQPAFTLDFNGTVGTDNTFFIPSDDKLLLAYLNSRLAWFLFSTYCTEIQNGFALIYEYIARIPTLSTAEVAKFKKTKEYTRLVKIVNQLLAPKIDEEQMIALRSEIDEIFENLFGVKINVKDFSKQSARREISKVA